MRLFSILCLLCVLWVGGCSEQPAANEEVTPAEKATQPEPTPKEEVIVDSGPAEEPVIFDKIGPPPPLANGVKGTIVHITDGDTFYVVTGVGGWAHRIRISGFNAPECKKVKNGRFQSCAYDDEAFGVDSYKIAKALIDKHGRKWVISCKNVGDSCEKDPFDRYLATLKTESGVDLGKELLLAGAGWAYTKFPYAGRAGYCRAEAEAIRKRAGLWKSGRAKAKQGMNSTTQRWYYDRRKGMSHDDLCTKAIGSSFSKLAGE